jgi:glucose/arabinose dehydrogenase
MKKASFIVGCILVVGGIIFSIFYYKYFRGAAPAVLGPVGNIADMLDNYNANQSTSTFVAGIDKIKPPGNTTDMPLKLPPEFSISIFAKNLPGARVLKEDAWGDIWVSQTAEGKITQLHVKDKNQLEVFNYGPLSQLNRPHGFAFNPDRPNEIFFAEEDKISRLLLDSEHRGNKIVELPQGLRHFTRTLNFGADERLYVSIGSTCDTCVEKDSRNAAIYSVKTDGSDFKLFAKGLRNSVFFTWHPETKKMWATEMGRDFLGDDLPPEEINIIEEGKHYGWPECYGKNIPDHEFDSKVSVSVCKEPDRISSYIDLPAHSAPLGLAFVPSDSSWPKEYWYNLLVAYHGSWNKSKPDGYKIVRIKLDKQGNYSGTEDFITGWLTPKGALGRPVDILIQKNGTMYVSDDKAGVIYRIIVKS